MLHWLFDGKDSKGTRYGIYVNKKKKGQGQKIDYFMYGRITGLRTMKGDDINYQGWDEDETIVHDINIEAFFFCQAVALAIVIPGLTRNPGAGKK